MSHRTDAELHCILKKNNAESARREDVINKDENTFLLFPDENLLSSGHVDSDTRGIDNMGGCGDGNNSRNVQGNAPMSLQNEHPRRLHRTPIYLRDFVS